ncbi:RagB/SusD family nutrient uptake outer membrane protein [Bacteroides thetaiotaomicron]|uniref:RagB/SusD family nutrient uptake outer membrane protein n=1 Tax=Bacteroides thetaiotaomicron TaxID=818 RepID=UPI002165C976|nr:RagB/SusD family nutrient uptake outer membrane protein [Bacteroides thetaiotaomicron]MCS3074959.1 RagB/SusD family nutrient uptake outer membrane protein [Bacteroides thetaiotaomicron]
MTIRYIKDEKAFDTALKHERQVEFFGEAKRYYDLNRWLDAMVEQNMPIRGM